MSKVNATPAQIQVEFQDTVNASFDSKRCENRMNEFCLRLLEQLSSSDGQPAWTPGVILTLKV